VGAFGELPEERQHRLHRRPGAEVGSGNAPHPELRPQVAERDQGSAGPDGAASRHGSAGLAAREYRRAGQALRGSLLIDNRGGRALFPATPFWANAGGPPEQRVRRAVATEQGLRNTPCVTARFIESSTAPPSIGVRCSPTCARR